MAGANGKEYMSGKLGIFSVRTGLIGIWEDEGIGKGFEIFNCYN